MEIWRSRAMGHFLFLFFRWFIWHIAALIDALHSEDAAPLAKCTWAYVAQTVHDFSIPSQVERMMSPKQSHIIWFVGEQKHVKKNSYKIRHRWMHRYVEHTKVLQISFHLFVRFQWHFFCPINKQNACTRITKHYSRFKFILFNTKRSECVRLGIVASI